MYLILGSCSNVQEKLNGLKEAVEALCEGTSVAIPTVQNTWTSVPITSIGGTDLRHPNTFSFVIPSVIPSTAKNVLIYTIMRCGFANLAPMESDAYNTNSDNMWFPMPINQRIYITVDKDVGTNCGAQLFAIGYN